MATGVDQAVCPKCGRQGLLLNTDKWRPVALRCRSIKCGCMTAEKVVAAQTEEEIFAALNLKYVEPELREAF